MTQDVRAIADIQVKDIYRVALLRHRQELGMREATSAKQLCMRSHSENFKSKVILASL